MLMVSDLERLSRNILAISSPGRAGFLLERAIWEEKVRALAGEVFMLGVASDHNRRQEQEFLYQREKTLGGDGNG